MVLCIQGDKGTLDDPLLSGIILGILKYSETCTELRNLTRNNMKNPLIVVDERASLMSGSNCWGTRTRTRKGRTRICSVTITPYPKLEVHFSDLKVQSVALQSLT